MKKILALTAVVLTCGLQAFAQDNPRFETFFGYTYLRANSATNVPSFSANGGTGQFAVNFNKWVGFVMDIGSVHNGNISSNHIDSTFTDYMFGPRISIRKGRVTPFVNFLLGGISASSSTAVSAIPVAGQPIYLPGQPT